VPSRIPKPTNNIYLHNDAQILHERRPEETIEELDRQMNIFKQFKYTHQIKTTNQEKNTQEAIEIVYAHILRNWVE